MARKKCSYIHPSSMTDTSQTFTFAAPNETVGKKCVRRQKNETDTKRATTIIVYLLC